MKSIKPGRGPSALNLAGSIIAIIFGVFWTIATYSIIPQTSMIDLIFPLFGLLFIGAGVVNAIYHFKNMTGKERMSIVDIVDAKDEGDPLHQRFVQAQTKKYCPYCGTQLDQDFRFCPGCGKEINRNN